jgi:1-deoxy-D-xylulose-5-phosphate reductoisomerase
VIASAPERFEVCTLTAHENYEALAAAALRLGARSVVIGNAAHEDALRALLKGRGVSVLSGVEALTQAVQAGTDLTVSAITGIAGLKPLMNAIKHSACVAIANKEPLVAAGPFVMEAAARYGTKILPLDSEHNAVFQVFDFERREGIERIILTASGGPFRTWGAEEIVRATPEQAIAHPNWDMGAKISVDSATMMNKALEVIEAHVLFGLPGDKIEVLIHPQSVVHSMVEYADGSILAQMGASDMRTPIAYALAWPERMETPGQRLDLGGLKQLDFEPPDFERFPALGLAYECIEKGLGACVALNAANEVAVDAFLRREICFPDILNVIEFALRREPDITLDSLDSVEKADGAVRGAVMDYLNQGALPSGAKTKAV